MIKNYTKSRVIKKTLLSLLPLYFCLISIFIFILTTDDILTSDGNGGVIRHSKILLQLTVWFPILATSFIGSGLYLLTMLFQNKPLIIGIKCIAIILGICIFFYLCFHMLLSIWLFPQTNVGIGNYIYFINPFLITLSFIFVFFLFMKDSKEILNSI